MRRCTFQTISIPKRRRCIQARETIGVTLFFFNAPQTLSSMARLLRPAQHRVVRFFIGKPHEVLMRVADEGDYTR
jgi:hypothetical protein